MATLERWTYDREYSGTSYSEYFQVIGRARDSHHIDVSNFETALARLGGESETVIVARATHWAVGWVETVMVHESDSAALTVAQEICDDLDAYHALDEEDCVRRESEATAALWEQLPLRERVEICGKYGSSIFAARAIDSYDLYERAPEAFYHVQELATE